VFCESAIFWTDWRSAHPLASKKRSKMKGIKNIIALVSLVVFILIRLMATVVVVNGERLFQ
jgi:hypothetical protein